MTFLRGTGGCFWNVQIPMESIFRHHIILPPGVKPFFADKCQHCSEFCRKLQRRTLQRNIKKCRKNACFLPYFSQRFGNTVAKHCTGALVHWGSSFLFSFPPMKRLMNKIAHNDNFIEDHTVVYSECIGSLREFRLKRFLFTCPSYYNAQCQLEIMATSTYNLQVSEPFIFVLTEI